MGTTGSREKGLLCLTGCAVDVRTEEATILPCFFRQETFLRVGDLVLKCNLTLFTQNVK